VSEIVEKRAVLNAFDPSWSALNAPLTTSNSNQADATKPKNAARWHNKLNSSRQLEKYKQKKKKQVEEKQTHTWTH